MTEHLTEDEDVSNSIEEKKNIIKYPALIKQMYIYSYARHLSYLGLPLNFYWIYLLIRECLAIKEIRDKVFRELDELEKDTDGVYKKRDMLNALNAFPRIHYHNFFILESIRKQIDTIGNEKVDKKEVKDELFNLLKKINSDAPIVNDYLQIIFVLCIKGTDLEYTAVPREEIINPENARFDKTKEGEIRDFKTKGY